eukprot:CAMPEP_0180037442 /NCGR_PEP_ID=MMETSP0984-20121128/31573_1 /TAXON_ID=483367 /ORGANISM="non described non described, Strain CCMP 2436" /LENGTH=164 /DNA_ID=CAMNT_0021963905 /DNA_START=526 /DNA_END=1016 /DNA_ORIENTATION=-
MVGVGRCAIQALRKPRVLAWPVAPWPDARRAAPRRHLRPEPVHRRRRVVVVARAEARLQREDSDKGAPLHAIAPYLESAFARAMLLVCAAPRSGGLCVRVEQASEDAGECDEHKDGAPGGHAPSSGVDPTAAEQRDIERRPPGAQLGDHCPPAGAPAARRTPVS